MAQTYIYIPVEKEELKTLLSSIIEAEFLKHKLIQFPESSKEIFIDVTGAAAILGRHRSRVYEYVRVGIISAYKQKGVRGLRFKKHEIEEAISKLDITKNIKTKPSNF
jgi:hypothetical protein